MEKKTDSRARFEAWLAARARNVPRVSYPPELPITPRADEIVAALRSPRRRVVIISGETGCGKSTQIPKMCLEAGRGVAGRIGVTQPRRLAAMTIAARIAEEIGEPLGKSVGYKIRFQDRTSRDGYIKVMTDGILLAETQGDHGLHEYDTIIIDEAHERSLNIDFLLGIMRRLLDERPDLKLVITSATLDTEKFSKAFKNAPVIEVSGRLYPVELEYRVPDKEEAEDKDYVDQAVEAVEYLRRDKPPGDVLVFMPTEQDILETCRMLEGRKWPAVKVLPLFSRLPAGQQRLVYTVTLPKIVVATNVAEQYGYLVQLRLAEAKIAHLAYAPEIANAMLRRQQAEAVVMARQTLVNGAVGMVEGALRSLEDKNRDAHPGAARRAGDQHDDRAALRERRDAGHPDDAGARLVPWRLTTRGCWPRSRPRSRATSRR